MVNHPQKKGARVSSCHHYCVRRIAFGLVFLACCVLSPVVSAQEPDEQNCYVSGGQRYCVGADGVTSLSPLTAATTVPRTTSSPTPTTATTTTTTEVHDDHDHEGEETHTDDDHEAEETHTDEHDHEAEATHTDEHDHATETGLTNCHMHGDVQYCTNADGEEVEVPLDEHDHDTETGFTNCHMHEDVQYCTNANGEEVEVPLDEHDEHEGHDHDAEVEKDTEVQKENCHFHAGVEHCDSDEANTSAVNCSISQRTYNKKIRIGAIFIVLCTSSIAVFGPILLSRFTKLKLTGLVFTVLKQFGTGVIIATSYVHLLTHANLLFSSPCMGTLKYEATTNAVAMAGIFSAFFVEYIGDRIVQVRANKHKSDGCVEGLAPPLTGKEAAGSGNGSLSDNQEIVAAPVSNPHIHAGHGHSHGLHGPLINDKLALMVMEGGIIFHSILIGITLVVAGDSVFATLLVVIIFHQMFEGLALGARISMVPNSAISLTIKLLMAAAFALITPIGMGIGVGVLNQFNGNDKSTLVAMATLDAFSAGILVWVGLVEMWAGDWVFGELRTSGPLKTLVAFASLMGGMILMGLLGKWA